MSLLENIMETLLKNKQYLASKYGVSSIGLFGEAVTEEFHADSEIDIIVDFKKPIGLEIVDLADELETLTGHKVDLVSKGKIEKDYYKVFRKEIQYVVK